MVVEFVGLGVAVFHDWMGGKVLMQGGLKSRANF